MRSPAFLVLYAAVLVATMGISMVSPLLPVYAERLGATGVWIGLTFSVFAITQTAVAPFAGGWSDRFGRKPFIVAGLLLYLLAAIGYLTAGTFIQVLAFRALSGLGTSLIFSVARAYIGDMAPEGHEGSWFGVFATSDVIGFGVGPLFAGAIREVFGFSAVFVGMALLMASSATIVGLLLPRHPPGERRSSDVRSQHAFGSLAALRDPLVLGLVLNMGLVALTFGSIFSFLGVRLEDLGVGAFMIGVAFAMESVASGVSQPVLGWLADHTSRRAMVALGLLLASAMLLGLGVADTLPVILLLLLGMGLGASTSMVASGAMQVEAGRRAGMGTVIGLGAMGNGVGVVVGSVAGGFVAGQFGPPAAFYLAAVVMLIGIPVFLWLTSDRPPARAAEVPELAAD